ncbi:MAG TPA: heme-binding protein [Gammaproteobacteria bacterium]|nr:heme-binding protein [Gammaproteobacteria bacterium]
MKRCLLLLMALLPLSAVADSTVVNTRMLTLDLAADMAMAAVRACRKEGYQVSVVVVDRAAVPQVELRDAFASRFTTEIARRKANAVILSGVSTAEFRANRAAIVPEMNELDGILVLAGALPVRAGGSLLGAIGVSGAPGGDKDEACARAGLDSIGEQLEFLD